MSRKLLALFACLAVVFCFLAVGCGDGDDEAALDDSPDDDSEENPDSTPMVMIEIPAGEFLTGCRPNTYPDELGDFFIDKTEVTREQYLECAEAGTCEDNRPCLNVDEGIANLPAQCISWYQARDYCEWFGKRLPSHKEFEKAARGPDGRDFPWGNEWDPNKLNWCDAWEPEYSKCTGEVDGWEHAAPVGSYAEGASPYGILDIVGNVLEWTSTPTACENEDEGECYNVFGWAFNRHREGQFLCRLDTSDPAHGSVEHMGFRCASDEALQQD
jgi:formylglycine-generating enzyme required for sulfatase activity